MLKNLAKKLTNNLGLKVLAVLFAIALWIVVVNIDDPVKPAQYTISVTQDNMDYLTSNGKYLDTWREKYSYVYGIGKTKYSGKIIQHGFYCSCGYGKD